MKKILTISLIVILAIAFGISLYFSTLPDNETMHISELKLSKEDLLKHQAWNNQVSADAGVTSIIICGDYYPKLPTFWFLGNTKSFDQGKYITEGFSYIGLNQVVDNNINVTTIQGNKKYDGDYIYFEFSLTGKLNYLAVEGQPLHQVVPEFQLQLNKQVPYDKTNTSTTLQATYPTLEPGDCIAISANQ